MPSADEHFRAGNARRDDRKFAQAVADYDRAVALDPDHAAAWSQRGLALLALGRKAEALANCAQATTLEPESPTAWITLGRLFSGMNQHDLALKSFRTAHRLAPDRAGLNGLLLQEQMLCCDWDGLDALVAAIEKQLAAGVDAVHPFYWQAMSSSPKSLLLAARLHQHSSIPAVSQHAEHAPALPGHRIRIGYVSGELNLSPNGLVMAGVFDHHDHDAFDITAFDNSRDDGTALRQRISGSFTKLIDISSMSDAELANTVRAEGIDILVDLNGFFGNSRSAMFRHRPAPVQVSYLGCPGTSGADDLDYVIADQVVIPDDQRRFYSESVVHLPETYYPTDRQRVIADRLFSRAECGLPEAGFVFCCFNHCHKILPETFARWMRILGAVDGSVLWLLDANPVATSNLKAATTRHGIDPARLIFAPRLAPEEHLARHRCADLFLDTLPYNAHTTATDALWSGLPVLTCIGTSFPGRVAASLLQAMEMPELITTTGEDYQDRAIALATRPDKLASLRQTLAVHRLTTALFDTARFTRHLEAAYCAMHRRRCDGLPPDHIVIGEV